MGEKQPRKGCPSMTIRLLARFCALVFAAILIFACGLTAPASTPIQFNNPIPSTANPTATGIIPTSGTPATPTQTLPPSPSPTSRFPSRGPYFAYVADGNLTLRGADNAGRKDIPLPAGARAGSLPYTISPDGKHLAYWTGYAGEIDFNLKPLDPNGKYDLQLNLLNVLEGTSETLTGLLSPDYPANFRKNAEAIEDLPEFQGYTTTDIANILQISFLTGIESAAWSPDSRYLAFAGEMDGPSSDLYVYDAVEKSVLRLSSGGKNMSSIDWSPDGKWIMYSSTFSFGEGVSLSYYATLPDGSASRDFQVDSLYGFMEWVSPSAFLISEGANGIGQYEIRKLDVETGAKTVVWPCPYEEYGFDPEQGSIIVNAHPKPYSAECQLDGLYLGFPSSQPRLLFARDEFSEYARIHFIGQGDRRFLLSLGADTYFVTAKGDTKLILHEDLIPFVSPNRQWAAFAGKGLRMMDSSGELSGLLTDLPLDKQSLFEDSIINWRPDSEGLLFKSGADLYFVSLPDKTVIRLTSIPYPSQSSDILWQPDSQGYFFVAESSLYFLSLQKGILESVQTLTDVNGFDGVWVAVSE
jgi:hypothetical protein